MSTCAWCNGVGALSSASSVGWSYLAAEALWAALWEAVLLLVEFSWF